jgi:alpha-methylacyl-CoA racemase
VAFCGILLALLRRGVTARGQVVEANMVDGVGFLGTFPRLGLKTPLWDGERGANLLDGGAPFYRCYQTKEKGAYVAVGALEDRFFDQLLEGLGLTETEVLPPGFRGRRNDKDSWAFMHAVFEKRFREKTRSEWEAIFNGTDACVTPVLEMAELEHSAYEQRPIVALLESPAREVQDPWHGRPLRPGEGGEARLEEWLGWRRGRDFDVLEGALVKLARSKL